MPPPITSPAQLGQALRQARLDHNLTQADVADLLGTHRRYVHAIEKGHTGLFVSRLFDLLELYDVAITTATDDGDQDVMESSSTSPSA